MDPHQSLLHAIRKMVTDRSNQPTHRPNSNSIQPPPPPYTPSTTATPAAAAATTNTTRPSIPTIIPFSRSAADHDLDTDEGVYDHDDLESTFSDDGEDASAHLIEIDARTIVSGSANIVQSDAAHLGARIAAHLASLLREADADDLPKTLSGSQAPTQFAQDSRSRRWSRPVKIRLNCSSVVGGTRNILGGPSMRVRPAGVAGEMVMSHATHASADPVGTVHSSGTGSSKIPENLHNDFAGSSALAGGSKGRKRAADDESLEAGRSKRAHSC